MSYANVIMYGSVLPSYDSRKDKAGKHEKNVINADNPKNRDAVRKILFG
jgi:hypothetical protein